MAQPMRVCDREAIVNKIKTEWEKTSLNNFKQSFEGSERETFINDRLKELKTISEKMTELEKDFDAMNRQIDEVCTQTNKNLSAKLDTSGYQDRWIGTYIKYTIPYTYKTDVDFKIETNVDYNLLEEIRNELAIATIGGDFDIQQIIKDLTDRFINQDRT